jgi:hypothetical protein
MQAQVVSMEIRASKYRTMIAFFRTLLPQILEVIRMCLTWFYQVV